MHKFMLLKSDQIQVLYEKSITVFLVINLQDMTNELAVFIVV